MASNSKFLLVFFALNLLFSTILVHRANAREFKVGGLTGTWTVPADSSSMVYNQWAERNRFQIGDSLLFVYDTEKDSVLWVNEEDYEKCNKGSPLATYNDGRTKFKLNHSGPYYFISGSDGNCAKNEKMVVVVMADRSGKASPSEGSAVGHPPPPPPPMSDKNSATTVNNLMHWNMPSGFILLGLISVLLA